MARFLKKKEATLGLPPGSAVFVGEQKVAAISIKSMLYTQDKFEETIIDPSALPLYVEIAEQKTQVQWFDVVGLHDSEMIKNIGTAFNLHSLTVEDILHTGQRPKMVEFDHYLYFVLKMMYFDQKSQIIRSEQLSVVLGDSFVLTFQEQPSDVFDPVRERIRKSRGRIRKNCTDYLTYTLLDSVVDNYISSIEHLGEQIEDLEDEVITNPNQNVLGKINLYKREINYLRKTVRPAREFILQLSKLESDLICESSTPFLKDLLDLSTQSAETIETYRDILSDYLEVYSTGINNRLNEIMKVLTIFSAIFIPLTFITGIYGTNFEHLPELRYRYSYFIFWGVLISVALFMLRFFRRRNWL
ncbi:MAG: magnesium/cobalt transporter CorA [Desulfuromonadaceae bacterium]|nr:magnesium/cobalt transporter CorA [Desulfuromonas sp.]MDY0184508.1 magnesium/cobalt transporter CorA [Desulfuromonadaceae bacterium]